jgi:hypothetical protein
LLNGNTKATGSPDLGDDESLPVEDTNKQRSDTTPLDANDLTGNTRDMNRCSPVREDTPLVAGRTCRITKGSMTSFCNICWVKWVYLGSAFATVLAITVLAYASLSGYGVWTTVARENAHSANVAFIGKGIP